MTTKKFRPEIIYPRGNYRVRVSLGISRCKNELDDWMEYVTNTWLSHWTTRAKTTVPSLGRFSANSALGEIVRNVNDHNYYHNFGKQYHRYANARYRQRRHQGLGENHRMKLRLLQFLFTKEMPIGSCSIMNIPKRRKIKPK